MVPGDGLDYEVSVMVGTVVYEYVTSGGGESATVSDAVMSAEPDG